MMQLHASFIKPLGSHPQHVHHAGPLRPSVGPVLVANTLYINRQDDKLLCVVFMFQIEYITNRFLPPAEMHLSTSMFTRTFRYWVSNAIRLSSVNCVNFFIIFSSNCMKSAIQKITCAVDILATNKSHNIELIKFTSTAVRTYYLVYQIGISACNRRAFVLFNARINVVVIVSKPKKMQFL